MTAEIEGTEDEGGYMTPQHVINQRIVANMLEKQTGWVLERNPNKWAPINFRATLPGSDDPVAYIALKCRHLHTKQEKDVICEPDKYAALRAQKDATGVPTYYVIGFKNGIGWIEVEDIELENVREAGRPDRPGDEKAHGTKIMVWVDRMTGYKLTDAERETWWI